MIKAEEKIFKVTAESECHKVVAVEPITRVIEVNTSIHGAKGENATINGLNTIDIVAGENIEIEQEEGTLTVNATATPQIQSDWSEVDNTKKSYIKNKITKLSELENDIEETDPIYTADKPNIALKSEIPAEQIQSDMAQTDDTEVDYIKNKETDNILFIMKEEGEIIYQDTLTNFLWLIIDDIISPLGNDVSNLESSKQNTITETNLTIDKDDWYQPFRQDNYEVSCTVAGIKDGDKVWYSPTITSIDTVASNEIYMKEYATNSVTFQAKYLPTEDINMVIRRCD